MDKNEIFTLWIPDNDDNNLSQLAHLSLKSFLLCDYDVILYTYDHIGNVPNGVCIRDANEILDKSKIFRYKGGFKTYSGFANLFRYKRLYEYGGTWLDLDLLLIKRLSDEDIIIGSQTQEDIYSNPNNAMLRFPPKDPLIKTILDYSEKRGSDINHAETGTLLLKKLLASEFPEYNQYLKHFNYSNIVNWNDVGDYLESPEIFLNCLNTDEIYGFHLFNTFFKKFVEFPKDSFFTTLKDIILNSSTSEEYAFNLMKYNITTQKQYIGINEWDLSYLNIFKDAFSKNEFKYTILIDSQNLKKMEIYNIIRTIFSSYGLESEKDIQIIICGKSDIGHDKIKFKDNVIFLASDFQDMKYYLNDYIFGEHIFPINKPVIFKEEFFKNNNFTSDVEHHVLNNSNSILNVLNRESYKLCLLANIDVFNLDMDVLKTLNMRIKEVDNSLIYDYSFRDDDVLKLMKLVDQCDSKSFLNVKSELSNLNIKFLSQKTSYHYFSAYKNILNSNSYDEFILKEHNDKLQCLNAFYLNRINPRYDY